MLQRQVVKKCGSGQPLGLGPSSLVKTRVTVRTLPSLPAAGSIPFEGANYKMIPAAQGSLSSVEMRCFKAQGPFSGLNVDSDRRPSVKRRHHKDKDGNFFFLSPPKDPNSAFTKRLSI